MLFYSTYNNDGLGLGLGFEMRTRLEPNKVFSFSYMFCISPLMLFTVLTIYYDNGLGLSNRGQGAREDMDAFRAQ